MDLFERAMTVSRTTLRPSSLSVYRSMWQRYCGRLGAPSAIHGPAKPGRESVNQMRDAIEGAGSYNTQKRLFALIRRIYVTLQEVDGLTLTNAIDTLYKEYIPDFRPAVQSLEGDWKDELVNAAYQYAKGWKGARLAAMAAILTDTALKTKELRELTFEQLHENPPKRITVGHKSHPRELELSPFTQAILVDWLAVHPAPSSSYVFVADAKGGLMDSVTLWRQLKRITQDSMNNPPVKHYGTGVIRATKAQSMRNQGYSIPKIAKFLGHRQQASTGELLDRIF